MKICVATFGSDGDLQPYLALALALKAAGHEVLFHTMDRYQPRVESLGLRFHLMGKWNEESAAGLGRRMLSTRNPAQHLKMLYETLMPDFLAALPQAHEALEGVDLVVSHVIVAPMVAAARVQKKPLISGHLFPNVIPSRNISPLGGAGRPASNRLLWWLVRTMLRRYTDDILNQVFLAAGLPAERDIQLRALHSPLLNLVALSPQLLPSETGWPPHYRVTGYWFLDEPGYTPDASLAEFLAAGEPPTLITFGSMTGMDVAAQTRTLVEGVVRSGKRVIFQAGWAGFGEGELPPQVRKIGVVPHSWLLPRVSGVIHHGGAGTTAACFRAGVPQGIVWHLGDQSSWGNQARSLGVGPAPVWYGKLRAEWVERVVRSFHEDKGLQQRAKALGETIRAEDGLREAVRAIEAVAPR